MDKSICAHRGCSNKATVNSYRYCFDCHAEIKKKKQEYNQNNKDYLKKRRDELKAERPDAIKLYHRKWRERKRLEEIAELREKTEAHRRTYLSIKQLQSIPAEKFPELVFFREGDL